MITTQEDLYRSNAITGKHVSKEAKEVHRYFDAIVLGHHKLKKKIEGPRACHAMRYFLGDNKKMNYYQFIKKFVGDYQIDENYLKDIKNMLELNIDDYIEKVTFFDSLNLGEFSLTKNRVNFIGEILKRRQGCLRKVFK